MVTLYAMVSPLPEQLFAGNVGDPAALAAAKIALAVLCIFASPEPEQGDVVDPTAPHRAAVSTEACNRLTIHTM